MAIGETYTKEQLKSKFKAGGYKTSIDLSSVPNSPSRTEPKYEPSSQSITDEGLSEPRNIFSRTKDFLTGAARSISAPGRTIQDILPRAISTVPTSSEDGLQPGQKASEMPEPEALETTSGKIGEFVGEAATFAIPAGFAAKATRGASILSKIGAQGVSDATIQSLNQGEVNKNTIDAGIIGAIFPAGGEAVSAISKNFAPRIVNSLIKPLLKDFSYGKNPGKVVAEEGITANSLEGLAANIKTVRQQVGQQLDQVVSGSKKVFTASDVFNPLDDALETAQKNPRTNSAVIKRLQNIKDDLLRVGEDGLPTRDVSNLSANELWELNKEVGDMARWTGNASDDEIVNKTVKRIYGNISSKLDDVDGVSSLKDRYANLKSAEIATQYRDKIAARQGLISLSGVETGLGAGLVTSIATGGITVPLLVGAGVAGLTQAAKTPAVKTRLATWLAQAGKDEIESAFKQAPWLRGTLQSILFSEDTDEETTD